MIPVRVADEDRSRRRGRARVRRRPRAGADRAPAPRCRSRGRGASRCRCAPRRTTCSPRIAPCPVPVSAPTHACPRTECARTQSAGPAKAAGQRIRDSQGWSGYIAVTLARSQALARLVHEGPSGGEVDVVLVLAPLRLVSKYDLRPGEPHPGVVDPRQVGERHRHRRIMPPHPVPIALLSDDEVDLPRRHRAAPYPDLTCVRRQVDPSAQHRRRATRRSSPTAWKSGARKRRSWGASERSTAMSMSSWRRATPVNRSIA